MAVIDCVNCASFGNESVKNIVPDRMHGWQVEFFTAHQLYLKCLSNFDDI